MGTRQVILQRAGVILLALAALTAIVLAWPASRVRTGILLSSDPLESGWTDLESTGASDPQPLPDLMLTVDRPASILLGREDRIGLTIDLRSDAALPAAYSVDVELSSSNAWIAPPGPLAQALRGRTSFEWTMAARGAPEASATLLVRLRRHSGFGTTEPERLVLARDLALPVRTIVGLPAPAARIAAAVLGLAGAVLGIASLQTRRR